MKIRCTIYSVFYLLLLPLWLSAQIVGQQDKTYVELIKEYNQGIKNYRLMPDLVKQAMVEKDTSMAKNIANDYIVNYLKKLKDIDQYTPEHIRFIAEFTEKPTDPYFDLFTKRTGLVNNTLDKNAFAQNVVDKVLVKSVIEPNLKKSQPESQSDWDEIQQALLQNYDPISAQRAVLKAQISYYYYIDWPAYCKALTLFTNLYEDHADAEQLNRNAISILLHSNTESELTSALAWSENTVSIDNSNAEYQRTTKAIQERIKKLK